MSGLPVEGLLAREGTTAVSPMFHIMMAMKKDYVTGFSQRLPLGVSGLPRKRLNTTWVLKQEEEKNQYLLNMLP